MDDGGGEHTLAKTAAGGVEGGAATGHWLDKGGGEHTLAETAAGGIEGGVAAGHSLDGGGEVLEGDEGAGVGEVHEINIDARGRRGSITSLMCGFGKNRASATEG